MIAVQVSWRSPRVLRATYEVLKVSKCGCDLIEQEGRRKEESSGRPTTSFRAEGQEEGLFRTCFNGLRTEGAGAVFGASSRGWVHDCSYLTYNYEL